MCASGHACDLSVSIVTFESRACLPDLVAALRAQTGVEFEALFVDNGSGDGSASYLARAGIGSVTQNADNVGFGRAHNQNLPSFRGRYVLLLNPDVRFEASLFADLVQFLDAHQEIAIAGPRVVEGSARCEFAPRRFYPGEGMVPLAGGDRGRDIAWLNGCCLIVRRDVLEALGGFDPDYFLYGEEIDLCFRARRAGHHIGWCPSTLVHHLQHQSQTGTSPDERARRLFAGIATFWGKHYRAADVRKMLRFQAGTCRLLLLSGPGLASLSRRWPALAPERVRARLAICRARMDALGMRRSGLHDLPLAIILRQLDLLRLWLRHGDLPLDDF